MKAQYIMVDYFGKPLFILNLSLTDIYYDTTMGFK